MATLAHHFEEGGWGMYPILWCSVILVAVTIERALSLYRSRPDAEKLVGAITGALRTGDVGTAFAHALANEGAVPRLARIALRHAMLPVDRIDAVLQMQLAHELAPLRRRLRAFGAIAGVATLLGLLGTVTGLAPGYGCFANADAASRATMLARGISESMNCLALALFVSVCAIAASYAMHARADVLESELRASAKTLHTVLVDRRPWLRWNGLRPPIERATYRENA